VAVGSRDAARAGQVVEPYAKARALRGYEAVVEDPEVDCVYIPLVNNLHREWTVRALEAGKHVLCEKPLAMNEAEARDMATVAQRSNRLLMEAFMYRFNPAAREFVESARDAFHVEARFGFTLGDGPNYRREARLGGGALLDVGCYTVSVSRWLLGEPASVLASAHMQDGVDMSVAAVMEFEGGRTASIFASFESAENQEVTAISRDEVLRLERPFNPLDGWLEQYRLMVESFGDSVLDRKPAEIPVEESIANMRVLDQIREASSRRRAAR
jgi:predicted dehydrogenase